MCTDFVFKERPHTRNGISYLIKLFGLIWTQQKNHLDLKDKISSKTLTVLPASLSYYEVCSCKMIDYTVSADGDCFHPNVCSSCAPLWDMKNIIETKVVVFHFSEVQCNGNLKIY